MSTPLPRFQDGSSVLWATLALGTLDQLIPRVEMVFVDLEPIPLRITLDKVLDTFHRRWTDQPPHEIESLITEFQENAACYSASPDLTPTEADTIDYCVDIFSAFHTMAIERMLNPRLLRTLSWPATLTKLVEKLNADVFEPALEPFLREYARFEQLPDVERIASVSILIQDCALNVRTQMMEFIRSYEWREDPPILEHDECHDQFAIMIEDSSFREYIMGELWELYDDLQRFENLSMRDRTRMMKSTIGMIATFFSYTGELLFPPETDDDEYSEDSEDWQEYEVVNDLDPVLTGPETATVDQVSSEVLQNSTEADCCICLTGNNVMRQLNVCNHMFCEDCLTSQLNAEGNYRYKCAICRAEMFP